MIGGIFLRFHNLILKNKISFIVIVISLLSLSLYGIKGLNIDTSIYSVFPDQPELTKIGEVLENDLNKNVVISVSIEGLDEDQTYDRLDSVVSMISEDFNSDFESVIFEMSDLEDELLSHFYSFPYYFLKDGDYEEIEQGLITDSIHKSIINVRKQLGSANGIFMRELLLKDPLGILWKRLGRFDPSSNSDIDVQDGLLLNKSEQIGLIKCKLNENERTNKDYLALEDRLDKAVLKFSKANVRIDYFSPFLISNANAKQIKRDTRITLGITAVLLIFVLVFYYRNPLVSLFFGALIAMSVILGLGLASIFLNDVSGIAIASSAVILGIVLDYAFHFITHYSDHKNLRSSIQDLSKPLLIGSFTTIVAFTALIYTDSSVLKHFGIIAFFVLSSSVILTLTVLPFLIHLIPINFGSRNVGFSLRIPTWIKRLTFLATVAFVLLVFIRPPKIIFDSDLQNLSYHPKELKDKESKYIGVNPNHQKRVMIFSEGSTLEDALLKTDELFHKVNSFEIATVTEVNSISPFVIVPSLAEKRLNNWNAFWTLHFSKTNQDIKNSAISNGLVESAFKPFESFVNSNVRPQSVDLDLINEMGLGDFVTKSKEGYRVKTSITVDRSKLSFVYSEIRKIDGVVIVDAAEIAGTLLDDVQNDFNYLLLFSSILVFISLFIVYGRLELALFSFFPMAVSWLWILYIGELVGVSFNYVNIILASIIFGLGDDFSIFVTDGLLKKYSVRKDDLLSYNKAIVLSALTTILGTGVLIFAEHPAIRSIALLSVVGVASILLVTVVLQPLIFNFFVLRRVENKFTPITLLGMLYTFFLYAYFVTGCILLNFSLILFLIVPVSHLRKRKVINFIISKLAASTLFMGFHVQKKLANAEKLDFGSPSIFIANHISFLDILLTLKLSPKMIIVVKDWVYNSPFFGLLIRYSGYICINEGNVDNLKKIKERLNEGFSVMIFPEGTRSYSGEIQRFHKGAFMAAKELEVDIQPILITGAELVNPKGDFIIKKGKLTVNVLDRIEYSPEYYGRRLGIISREVADMMREKLQELRKQDYDSGIMGFRISYNYLYKGPVLEWYFRVKWKLESKNFERYNELIGDRKRIYDLGTGYGYLPYYLHYSDPKRVITGIDYDIDKIEIAEQSYLKDENLRFVSSDVSDYAIESFDAMLLCDVLHYMDKNERRSLLEKAVERINENGIILIREGISDFELEHRKTAFTEFLSTKIFKFNKAYKELDFLTKSEIEDLCDHLNMNCELIEQENNLSNTLIVLTKAKAGG